MPVFLLILAAFAAFTGPIIETCSFLPRPHAFQCLRADGHFRG